MSAIDVTALGLASHVALGWTDIGPTGGCVAWVESRADEFGTPSLLNLLGDDAA